MSVVVQLDAQPRSQALSPLPLLSLGEERDWERGVIVCIYNDLSSAECWECGERDRVTNKIVFNN